MSADIATSAGVAADSSDFVLDAETFKKIHPAEYHRRFFAQGVRPDGRSLEDIRTTLVTTDVVKTAHGSSMVKIGNTTVICGIKGEVAAPLVNTPEEGYLVPNIDLPPLCSAHFKSGPPGEATQTMSELLNKITTSSKMFDLKTLCIAPGNAVWVLYADIACINYDGNVFDAALVALLAALENVRLPKATWNEEEGSVQSSEKCTVALTLQRRPTSTTFGIFDGETLLVDPTDDEEMLLSSTVTVALDEAGVLCGIRKPGGSALPLAVLQRCIEIARMRSQELLQVLRKASSRR
ncbi:ribosomal protein S5 domain 2-type protein [Polychytrium aggregatum]|uniref:ribosomal protein S5 domain 2-type protein n=1 Tax=Polychytrium aggregatum TaxID=110093 RepID=UPI0022FF227F|nr:ribosomal protein S5 domain 2-type protein [Polychytrium aggregatum]KAI9199580.1 ribosomal protein S5 domain 2-type protein [Polychytrium aggregatum]